jgi:glutamate/tyrosine decarboxylase-like PLP-dependent enzyme
MLKTPEFPLYGTSRAIFLSAGASRRKHISELELPQQGQKDTEAHLQGIAKSIIKTNNPNYFAFVTGGVTPIAAKADNLVTEIDASPQTHGSKESIATDVEDTTLRWLLRMFDLDEEKWTHRTITTGATASNVLGLACGRDYVVQEAARRLLKQIDVADSGLYGALQELGKRGIRILTTLPHSSLGKAASIVGLGRKNITDVSDKAKGSIFAVDVNLEHLESLIRQTDYLHIVAISCGEVNTGFFATSSKSMKAISRLCKENGAWLHVDGGGLYRQSIVESRLDY